MWDLPDLAGPKEVRAALGLTSGQLSDLQRQAGGDFPVPAEQLSARRPRWRREDLARWAVDRGYAPIGALPIFDPPHERQAQRWEFDRTEFATLDVDGEGVTFALMRYRPHLEGGAPDYGPERVLTVCFVVDHGEERYGPQLLRGGRLPAERVAELGYSEHRGGGVVLLDVGSHRTAVITVEVPPGAGRLGALRIESKPTQLVAEIIGHPLPLWPAGTATAAAAAMWDPTSGRAVPLDVPPKAERAGEVRRQLRTVVDDLAAGGFDVSASDRQSVIDGLCAAGNVMWDHAVEEKDPAPKWPWVRPYVPAGLSTEEKPPVLPVAPRDHLFDALAWLFEEPTAPRELARDLAASYGSQEAIAPVTIDLAGLPGSPRAAALRAAIDANLLEADVPETWMRTAVAECLVDAAAGVVAPAELVWSTTPEPRRFPVLQDGSLLSFHVPRQLPEGFELDTLHIIRAAGDRIAILALDLRGRVAVVPVLVWDPIDAACCLTALALGLPAVDALANIEGVHGAPEELVRVLRSVLTVGHAVVTWSTVRQLVGERPAGMADADVRRFVSWETTWPLTPAGAAQ